jgi:hypothetical protein
VPFSRFQLSITVALRTAVAEVFRREAIEP